MSTMAEVVSERGYALTRVSDVLAPTGISRRTFYVYFANRDDCFFATYDAIAKDVAEVLKSEPADPTQLLADLLGYLASWPAHAHVLLFEILGTGPPGVERYEQTVGLLASTLAGERAWQPGRCRSLKRLEMAQAAVGAMLRIVQHRLVTQGGEALPGLLPSLVALTTRVELAA